MITIFCLGSLFMNVQFTCNSTVLTSQLEVDSLSLTIDLLQKAKHDTISWFFVACEALHPSWCFILKFKPLIGSTGKEGKILAPILLMWWYVVYWFYNICTPFVSPKCCFSLTLSLYYLYLRYIYNS